MGGFTSAPSSLGSEPTITRNTITIHGIRATATRPFVERALQDLDCSIWITKAGRKVVVRVASRGPDMRILHRFGIELSELDVRNFKHAKRTGGEHRMVAAKLLNTETVRGEMAYQMNSEGLHMGVVVTFDAKATANRTWSFIYQHTNMDATLLEFGLSPTDAQRVTDWILVPPQEGSRPDTWFVWDTSRLSTHGHSSGVGVGAGGASASAGAGAGAGSGSGSTFVRRIEFKRKPFGRVRERDSLEDTDARDELEEVSEEEA